ncbi:hypothetical protein ACIQRE_01830 [Streptomyces griseoluteus]|uniref:hypothetical protein n=1 Tax=Streptomyces griseoluteus TaxID=29306 RepID=UPI00381BDD61
MSVLVRGTTTVAQDLAERGLPADWNWGGEFGKAAARIYRRTYGREPGHALQLINGKLRSVMAYTPDERHVLTQAWESVRARAAFSAPQRPRSVLDRIDRALNDWVGSADSMRWRPDTGPLRAHP